MTRVALRALVGYAARPFARHPERFEGSSANDRAASPRRVAVATLLVTAAFLTSTGAAGAPFVGDVHRLEATVRLTGIDDRDYVVTVTVEKRTSPLGDRAFLTVEIAPDCRGSSCNAVRYFQEITPSAVTIEQSDDPATPTMGVARVKTKFAGTRLRVAWQFDEPLPADGEPGSIVLTSAAVSAAQVLNTGCYGTGSYERRAVAAAEEAPPPEGRKAPSRVPRPFMAKGQLHPHCAAEFPPKR